MKVLIISKFFAPQINEIGAVRPTKIAKYLKRLYNCDITVATMEKDIAQEDSIGIKDLEYVDCIIKQKDVWWARKLTELENNIMKNNEITSDNLETYMTISKDMVWKKQIFQSIKVVAEWLKERGYANKLFRRIVRNHKKFDLIVSSYGPPSSVILGAKCKKYFSSAIWIADFRDTVYSGDKSIFMIKIKALKISRLIKKYSDNITVVVPGIKHDMKWQNDRIEVITNGYDREDARIELSTETSKFTMSYTGGYYPPREDLDILFKTIRQLIDTGIIEIQKIQFCYAGAHYSFVEQVASKYQLEIILKNYGIVERARVMEIQNSTHLLVMASWNANIGTSDVLSGKFLEYMGARKPIIAIVMGDKPNCLIGKIILEAQIGFCYEETGRGDSVKGLNDYIKKQYENYISTGEASYEGNREYLKQFNYSEIAKKFMTLYQEHQIQTKRN